MLMISRQIPAPYLPLASSSSAATMARYEVELAEALGLPRIKKDKLVKALKVRGPDGTD